MIEFMIQNNVTSALVAFDGIIQIKLFSIKNGIKNGRIKLKLKLKLKMKR